MSAKRSFPLVPVLLLGAAFAFAFYQLWHVLIPFALAFAAAYVLTPLINSCQRRGLRRHVAVLALYAVAAVAIGLAANTLIQIGVMELQSLQAEGPAFEARLRAFAAGLQLRAAGRLPFGPQVSRELNARAFEPLVNQAESLPSYALGVFPLLSLLFLVPFITFFLLLDGSASVDSMIQACPSRFVEQALHLLSEIDTSLGNYLRGLIVVACAIGAASFLGLVILGVNEALWISLLAGVSSFVPYLGAIVGALVGGLAAWVQFGSFAAFMKVVALFALIRLADESLLQPFIAKHSVHLHPLIFLMTFMIGGEVFGFAGLLFAVPAACVVKALVKVAWSWYSTEAQLQVVDIVDLAEIPYT